MYKITPRQKLNASVLGVTIKPSTNKSKKIDVFKNGIKVAEIGAAGYMDFDLHTQRNGLEFAKERRRLYRIRHANNLKKLGTPGYYANKILW